MAGGAGSRINGRSVVLALWLAYLLFFVYGSLVPLHLQRLDPADAWRRFLALPGPAWPQADHIDTAVNFLLTLPLAFGLAHGVAALRRPGLRAVAAALAWPLLALLSLGIEFTQTFFPPRDPSWSDVAAQAAGSAVGLVAYAALGRRFRALLAGLAHDQPTHGRITRLLGVYLALLLAFSVMPLDLSLNPVELWRKWRDGRVILEPFTTPYADPWLTAYEFLSDVALWVPVGLLWRTDGRGRSVWAVLRRGVVAATLVELAQLLVLSRVSDVTDIILAGVGVTLGAALPQWLEGWAAWGQRRQARWLAAAWCLWLAVAAVILWAPFHFEPAGVSAARAAQAFTRTLFQNYFFRGEFHALSEIVRKMMVFLPGGLLLGAWAARKPGPWRPPAAAQAALLVGVAFALEAGQLFEPSKVADLTDALLGSAGALLGLGVASRLLAHDWAPLPAAAAIGAQPAAWRPASANAREAAVSKPHLAAEPAVVVALACLLWLASRLPGVPYNVPKLMPHGAAGAVAAAGLALAAWWMLAAPLWLLRPQRRAWLLAFPALAVVHAVMTFAVLRAAVPLAMVHKVIGDPVLGWGGPWEDIGRYVALHLSLMLPLFGAALLVRVAWRPATLTDAIHWCFVVLLLGWPLHWLVVAQAATDNLVELMRDGGSLGASAALATALLLAASSGSALALAAAQGRRRVVLLAWCCVAALVAPALLRAGLEPLLVKYGQGFSALQFILSASRARYATGPELAVRGVLALAGLVALVALLQWPAWRALAAPALAVSRRKAGPAGAFPAA